MRRLRALAIATGTAAASVLAFPLYLALRAADRAFFEPQTFDFVLLAASTFAIVLGAQAVSGTVRYVALLAVLASASLLFALLAVFSIGLAFLPAGAVLVLLLYRALRRAGRSSRSTRAALGGAAIGFALPLLYIALIIPPTVECLANGTGQSGGRWRLPQAVSVSFMGAVDANGVATGRMEYPDSAVTYRCERGKLVEFTRTPK